MIRILLSIIVILIIIVCYLISKIIENKKKLSYISSICDKVSSGNVNLRLRLSNTTHEERLLCNSINNMLNEFHGLQVSELESKESMKKMLSNISHDLRTPLTVMLGYIDQINYNENLPELDKKNYLLKLGNKTNEVINLINEFFSLSKLESGDKEILLSNINISETIREVILNFYDILTEKDLSTEIVIPDKDIYCLANKEALTRILENLITNSLKYGSDGTSIGIKVYEEENLVWIEQWDNGKGIDLSDKDKIFQRLYTVEDSRNKDYSGSGLGLTIVKALVQKMNSDIFVESLPYKKTTFKFYLNKETK
ncbi:sensor histidine kinase [Clostridium manihotivorum]|uniref:histidine kinase n=1 Tax=Clostridium manihotivorum TaxID=2320868 RepID=A0A3R5UCZ3_9CLOT|nr:HAMP domain-containing sensor histidine kinase [Clostridium manihotivorum]QAA30302.1 sensor histidine kinase [Clostridium manihotivorum]